METFEYADKSTYFKAFWKTKSEIWKKLRRHLGWRQDNDDMYGFLELI